MKAFRGTLFLALLVAIVAVFTYREFQSARDEKAQEAEKDRILPGISVEAIQRFEVKGPQNFVLERKDMGWDLVSPHQDIADRTAVDAHLNTLITQKGNPLPLADQSIVWQEYGLADPIMTLKLKLKSGEHVLRVSSSTSFDGNRFLRVDDQSKVYIGESNWQSLIDKRADDFREKQLYRYGQPVAGLSLQKGREAELKFSADGDEWRLEGRKGLELNEDAITEFLTALDGLRATGIAANDVEAATLKSHGLAQPLLRWQIQLPEGRVPATWALTAGKIDNGYYAMTSDRPAVFRISADDFQALDKELDDFRDKAYPFQFELGKASQVEAKYAARTLKLIRDQQVWKSDPPAPEGRSVEQVKVDELFKKLRDLQVAAFATQAVATSANHLSLKDEKNAEIFSLHWGPAKTVDLGEGKRSYHPAKTNLAKEGFWLTKERVDEITAIDFFAEEKADASAEGGPEPDALPDLDGDETNPDSLPKDEQ